MNRSIRSRIKKEYEIDITYMISDTIQTVVYNYDKIYGFAHPQSNQKETYLQLHIESGCSSSPLEIFEQYLVYSSTNTREYPF